MVFQDKVAVTITPNRNTFLGFESLKQGFLTPTPLPDPRTLAKRRQPPFILLGPTETAEEKMIQHVNYSLSGLPSSAALNELHSPDGFSTWEISKSRSTLYYVGTCVVSLARDDLHGSCPHRLITGKVDLLTAVALLAQMISQHTRCEACEKRETGFISSFDSTRWITDNVT